MKKNDPTLPTWNALKTRLFQFKDSALQMMRTDSTRSNFETCKEDPSLMNVFQKRNFKLLVDPIEQGIFCFEQDEKRTRGQCEKEPTILEKQNHITISDDQTAYFGQCIFQDQPKMTFSFKT